MAFQPFELQKGKLIDTQTGFVDAFNMLYKSVSNLEGGENCEVTWPLPDHPRIDVTADGNGNPGGDDGGGGSGEITVTGTDGSSHEGDAFTFASAADSNLSVTIAADGTMTFSVYYV